MISYDELQAIIDMVDNPPERWHSIRLERLKEICSLAQESVKTRHAAEIAKTTNILPPTLKAKRKGVDFACALFPGPLGDCTEESCICT